MVKHNSNRFLSFILSLASGLMISVVCFDLIPEALKTASIICVMAGTVIGVLSMIVCDELVQQKLSKKKNKLYSNSEKSKLLKTGIIVSIGLALHNIPEGLAIRSRF